MVRRLRSVPMGRSREKNGPEPSIRPDGTEQRNEWSGAFARSRWEGVEGRMVRSLRSVPMGRSRGKNGPEPSLRPDGTEQREDNP